LDPEQRRQIDEELAGQVQEQAVAEFHKYLTFAIADGVLTADEERNLQRFGREQGLADAQMLEYIEAELRDCGAKRALLAEDSEVPAEQPQSSRPRKELAPEDEFMRMLRLTRLDSESMSDDTRDAFVNMAENLGLEPADAEDLIDDYLAEADAQANGTSTAAQPAPAPMPAPVPRPAPTAAPPPAMPAIPAVRREVAAAPGQRSAHWINSLGMQMFSVAAGEFVMGSEAFDAGPAERPLTKMTLSRFFMSRFPVTNGEYEKFDPAHARKRAPGAGDNHPVVHVSHLEAAKFCVWLATRERKKYRLPTEAEWEYAAKGTDGRIYPWGNLDRRGDLANFADKNTVFAWSDREISDGYPESSPVGAFPRGASPFGLEDMAGNVWEWCHDVFEQYRGAPKINPRGPTAGAKRVHRGGSWKSRFNSLRTTARAANVASYSCNDLGFRIACDCE
ncbi:MAG: formylglycine-generating enzyme family protein, partial [Verrucomicrobiota bacterium]|nr:formylglycine-generating enzyme family protein [Verrucomicrobiota bacterium]